MIIMFCVPNMAGGGAERQLVYISGELVRRGHQVHVALVAEGPNYEALVNTGCVIHKIPALSNYDPLIILHLFRLIRSVAPDLVQTWILQMDVFGGIAARLAGIPSILSERSSGLGYPPSWKRSLRIKVAAASAAIISNSMGGDDYWRQQLPEVKRFVVRNGLPTDDITATLPDLHISIDPKKPIALYVGRLPAQGTAVKNINIFLAAIAYLRKSMPIAAVICGDGPQKEGLVRYAASLGISEDVHFTGYLSSKQVWALMKRASVFVSLSAYEGLPNAVLEAMACGCPMVISDIPAHRAILDDTSAMFVDHLNIQAVSEAIGEIVSNSAAAKAMANQALQRAREYSIPSVAEQYEKIYLQVLGNGATGT